MVINLNKCIGCEYCQRSCSATNDVLDDKPWNIVVEDQMENGETFFFSRPCLHCQDAPCVEVCPVQATYHREDGLVDDGLRSLHRLPLLRSGLPV